MIKDRLATIVQDIENSHHTTIQRKAAKGSVRAMELLWRQSVVEYYGEAPIPAWTGRQRQNCREVITKMGKESAIGLIGYAVENWGDIGRIGKLNLPPCPTFDHFFVNRDTFYSYMVNDKKQVGRVAVIVEKSTVLSSFIQQALEKRKQRNASKT